MLTNRLQEQNENSSSEEFINDGLVENSTFTKQQLPSLKKKDFQEDQQMLKCLVIPPGPDENPLTNKFCFWFSKRPNGKVDAKAYEKSMIPIGVCSSVSFSQLFVNHYIIVGFPLPYILHFFGNQNCCDTFKILNTVNNTDSIFLFYKFY